jgi:hypothetical protein
LYISEECSKNSLTFFMADDLRFYRYSCRIDIDVYPLILRNSYFLLHLPSFFWRSSGAIMF